MIADMATLTINGIGTELERKLSALAAEHGTTPSAEALRVMANALQVPATDAKPSVSEQQMGAHLYARMRAAVARYGPFDIELPARGTSRREPPNFSQWPD